MKSRLSSNYYVIVEKLNTRCINCTRTSDSLNEGLPIKLTRKRFKENDNFSMKKIVGSTIDLSTKAAFSLDKYRLKNMG